MKANRFFASVASKALALAAVLMMSAALVACSNDDDPTPQTLPDPAPNTVTIDGVTYGVTFAEYERSSSLFLFYLNTSYDGRNYFKIYGPHDLLGKGNLVDLTKKHEAKEDPAKFVYFVDNEQVFALQSGDTESGTLQSSFNSSREFSIVVKNCRAVYDGKPVTVTINFKGRAKWIGIGAEPSVWTW